MTYIKLLTVLAGLALLTACAGGVTINPTVINNGEGTSVPCDTNPFGSTCLADTNLNPRRVEIVSDCRTDKMGELCTDAIEFVCEQNYRDPICVGTAKYDNLIQMEETTCLTNNSKEFCDNQARITTCDASPFPDNCIEPKYVMQRRIECESLKNKSQCMATEELICGVNGDVFDPFCNGITNYVSVRETTCQTHGTDPDDGDSSCATILIPLCVIADPFAHAGCDDVEGINANIRTPYCETPANAWKPKCMDGMHGAVIATRVTACQMFGTNTGMGGDNSCATSLATVCDDIDDPFIYPGCDNVAGIDDGVRMMYCQMPANSFTTGCKTDGTHGDVDAARDTACLDGLATATGCDGRANVGTMCTSMPLPEQNAGCKNLSNYGMLLSDFCALGNNAVTHLNGGCGTTPAAVCPNNLFNPSAIIVGGTIDCLGDATFAPARLTACATEAELDDCDTTEIAPEVCKDSGANANPFAAFCETATNRGGDKTVAEIRQSALTACFDGMSDDDNDICQNTMGTRGMLATDCLLAGAFEPECDYTQYEPQKMLFCNDESTAWNPLCDGGTITGTDTARVTACQMFGIDTTAGGHATCADSLIPMCLLANPFIHEGCDDVVGIDVGFRTTYCALTVNAFKTKCKTDGTHGDVLTARGKACVEFGIDTNAGGHGSCIGNTLAESSCAMNPFDPLKLGCAILTEFPNIVVKYCRDTNPNADECAVKTSTWVENARNADDTADLDVKGVRAALANDEKYTLITGGAESLELGDTVAKHATNVGDLTFKNTEVPANGTFVGETAFTGNPNVAGGISYATNVGATKLYAGLLSDTNVGAPLAATPTANWLGRLGVIHGQSITTTVFHDVADFQLVIDFTNTTLSQTIRLISGAAYEQFIIAGEFNDKGVIYGRATYEVRRTSNNSLTSSGTGLLTGLIGQKGAAAVFHGTAGATDFVGGFVAVPYVPAEEDDASKVTFRDWLREFDYPLPTSSAVEIARTTSKPHFIRPKTDGTLDLTGVTGTTQHKATRAGDDKDGFAYGVGKIVTASTPAGISHNFVGILPSTDLGAPLTNPIETEWLGQFSFGNTATLNDIEFTLTFDGTNSGTIDGMFGFVRFDLDFDGKGIITGDVTYSPTGTNPTTTVARGLIGEEGLVGVFTNINNGNTAGIEFGGFVAVPPPPSVATHANFKTYYADSARVDGRTLYATPTATSRTVKFVEGTETSLVTTGLTFTGTNNFAPVTVRLKQASSGDDGFALMSGNLSGGNARRFGAGLLSGTDLGPALSGTSTANWTGSLHFARVVNTTPGIVTLPTVTVDFDNGTIKVNPVTVGTNRTVSIDGLFRAGSNNNGLPVGILGGKAVYTFTNDNEAYDLPLIGLIGTEGAIGVFHGESNDVGVTAIGGFQASPN